ncbi:hypothetical protein HID58_018497 [Brassica napus]|uniref:Uncharacterized protein n=1 Tax=Brassica napus TaxID=3708 RepID=A0ABQ8DCT4_BRANA|nr:hypothetical protein HID58_018497 [Brassica napus]
MFLKEANTILSIKPSQSVDPNRSFWHETRLLSKAIWWQSILALIITITSNSHLLTGPRVFGILYVKLSYDEMMSIKTANAVTALNSVVFNVKISGVEEILPRSNQMRPGTEIHNLHFSAQVLNKLPIFRTPLVTEGLALCEVVDKAKELGQQPSMRIRLSINNQFD